MEENNHVHMAYALIIGGIPMNDEYNVEHYRHHEHEVSRFLRTSCPFRHAHNSRTCGKPPWPSARGDFVVVSCDVCSGKIWLTPKQVDLKGHGMLTGDNVGTLCLICVAHLRGHMPDTFFVPVGA